METKFDRLISQCDERTKRADNLKNLREQMNDARTLLSVIPKGAGFEADKERRAVQAKIDELADLINDEQRAYDMTLGDDLIAQKIVDKII